MNTTSWEEVKCTSCFPIIFLPIFNVLGDEPLCVHSLFISYLRLNSIIIT